jgi:uncharacterized membrane protein YbhN (UPF0104 family)
VALLLLLALILVISPQQLGLALSRFRVALLVPIAALTVLFYLLQGLRWHLLLREIGVRFRVIDSTLMNLAGQAITALLPLGDLTRAVLASEISGAEFGGVAATVTVQELIYTFILLIAAVPGVLEFQHGVAALVAGAAFIALIFAILVVPPVFCFVHGLVTKTPLLRRFVVQVEELHNETVNLLHRRDTLHWSILDAGRAVAGITAFWLIVQGLQPGAISWWGAAFVLTLANIGGAISLIPGGAGANEAGVAALLILLGVPPGAAGAAALLQRVITTGGATVLGLAAWEVVRRRFDLGGIWQMRREVMRLVDEENQRKAA